MTAAKRHSDAEKKAEKEQKAEDAKAIKKAEKEKAEEEKIALRSTANPPNPENSPGF